MKKIFLLSKMLSRSGGDAKSNSNQNSDVFNLFLIIILALFGFCAGMFVTPISHNTISNTTMLTIFSVSAVLMSLIRVVPMIINSLFMSKDIEILLTLPYSPLQLALSNSINVIKTEGLYQVSACIAFTIGCFLADATDITNLIILSLLLIIFVTLFVSFLLILFSTLIIKVLKTLANREFQKILGVIIGAIGLAAIYVFAITSKSSPSADDVDNILNTVNNLSSFTYIIPVAPMLKNFICNADFLELLYAILITGATLLLTFLALNKFYLQILKEVTTTFINSKEVNEKTISESIKSNSVIKALIKKDLKLIFRDSSYYLYGILAPIIIGIFFEILFFQLLSNFMDSMPKDIMMASSLIIGCCIGLIASVGVVAHSGISACSLSREGESYIFIKQLPIKYKTQLKAKRNVALIMCFPPAVLIILGFSIYGIITGVILWFAPLIALITMIPISLFFCNKSILIDLKKPNLYATNFNKITSPKTLISILGIILVLISFALPFIVFIMPTFFNGDSGSMMIIVFCSCIVVFIIAIFAILAFVSNKNLYKRGSNLLNNL